MQYRAVREEGKSCIAQRKGEQESQYHQKAENDCHAAIHTHDAGRKKAQDGRREAIETKADPEGADGPF